MRCALALLLFAPPAFASSPDADAAAALALAKAARERGSEKPALRGGGWIPGTNPPQWSDSWMPPPPEPWIKPLVEPFSDWNVNHWDLPPAPKKSAAPVYPTGYPLRASWWSHPGEIHAHLKTGEHRGKWPAVWIDMLSDAEAESVHSDDHEGRVKWEYVPGRKPAPVKQSPAPVFCPPGGR